MRGAIPPLSQYVFMAWYIVKHRDNFTFTFTNIIGVIKSRRMRCVGYVRMEKMRMHTKLVGRLEGNRPLGRPRCGWEDNNLLE
jgi:hypothetical protein